MDYLKPVSTSLFWKVLHIRRHAAVRLHATCQHFLGLMYPDTKDAEAEISSNNSKDTSHDEGLDIGLPHDEDILSD